MLDAFIIEEIKRREQERERQRDGQRPRQELPVQPPQRRERDQDEPSEDRGVVIIDYTINSYAVQVA